MADAHSAAMLNAAAIDGNFVMALTPWSSRPGFDAGQSYRAPGA
jgi:hypothetical protein